MGRSWIRLKKIQGIIMPEETAMTEEAVMCEAAVTVSPVSTAEHNESLKDQIRNIPRGKAKSGRAWKTVRTGRYSEIRKTKAFSSSFEEKIQQKKDRRAVKLHEQQMKDALKKEKEDKRARKEENLKRRLENEKKSEVTQTIKNTAKIKRMKKK